MFQPSFGCNHNYQNFCRRLFLINTIILWFPCVATHDSTIPQFFIRLCFVSLCQSLLVSVSLILLQYDHYSRVWQLTPHNFLYPRTEAASQSLCHLYHSVSSCVSQPPAMSNPVPLTLSLSLYQCACKPHRNDCCSLCSLSGFGAIWILGLRFFSR